MGTGLGASRKKPRPWSCNPTTAGSTVAAEGNLKAGKLRKVGETMCPLSIRQRCKRAVCAGGVRGTEDHVLQPATDHQVCSRRVSAPSRANSQPNPLQSNQQYEHLLSTLFRYGGPGYCPLTQLFIEFVLCIRIIAR